MGHAPTALILHDQGSTTGSGKGFGERGRLPIYCDERNRLLTLRDTSPALLPIGAIGAFATMLLRYGKRRAWGRLALALRAWKDGIFNRRGKPDWV